jgi:hypothetical protein
VPRNGAEIYVWQVKYIADYWHCGSRNQIFITANIKACHWTHSRPVPSTSHSRNISP